ncbi:hypothetical protein CYLTODRAFT_488555 [Cylindrobasidium torrendii FP15055 ss-10]|uniref:CENP-V/GFA domain-containing protein n=1 Tax=Cylindrobasidium torrendii FP15055 ss-10 TaxID=1314674 RepID=A0A0D7BID2_9AGAR|nr:hypothetical protein CYLTODRAFT_488555 [Cylindrobasidium torrendii FP15055 ss-10]
MRVREPQGKMEKHGGKGTVDQCPPCLFHVIYLLTPHDPTTRTYEERFFDSALAGGADDVLKPGHLNKTCIIHMSIAPKPIEGGCLCGAVRYKVTFVADETSQTPSGFSAHACHCTMCRKHSGALFLPFLVIPSPSTIAWLHHSEPLPAHPHAHKDDTKPVINGTFGAAYPPSLKEYESSGICTRGFCGTCGSSLFWHSKSLNKFEIMTGTIDQEYLEAEEWRALATPTMECWTKRQIPGVTVGLFEGTERFEGD